MAAIRGSPIKRGSLEISIKPFGKITLFQELSLQNSVRWNDMKTTTNLCLNEFLSSYFLL